jgi:hypothetical protein
LDYLRISKPVPIAKDAKMKRLTVLSRKRALEKTPKVRLDNLLLIPQKDQKVKVLDYTSTLCGS